jgi:signal transduction histidine kinase
MDTKGRILVIDDEEGIRKGCARVLQPLGYTIDTAGGFQDGLKKVETGDFDLVLLDVLMPDGRGIDLLEPIRQRDSEAVAILITGYATVELAVDAIKRGAYNFISKPFTAQLLVMTVEQGLERRRLALEARRIRAMEKQVAELEQARQQAERLSEFKSAFATTVAHELRAPIGAAETLVRTLLQGLAGELNPRQMELLNRVDIRLDGLLALVNDLLTLAASRSLAAERPLEPVQLNLVVERVMQHYEVEATSKGVALSYAAPGREITVSATEDGLETVLGNLVGNALKYTPQQGSVYVELEEQDGRARLCVSDTGIGIAPEDLPRLGEEFFRGKNARSSGIQGTGLGLSITKELLKRFGSQMKVESQPGQGTRITLEFPLARGE